ncbi:hypothetical protein SUDANB105_05624 [Streptomyces sp. enrichment culture]
MEPSEGVERTTDRDVVVRDGLSYVQGPDGEMVSRIPERYVFDAHTQEPVHAGGETVDGDPVRREGIEFKWPFLTGKRNYQYFDAQARVTAPIHYKDTRDFRGLEVYHLEQTIPWTRVPSPKAMPVEGVTPVLLTTSYLPWGLLTLGALLLALALLLEARGRRPGGPPPARTTEPAPLTALAARWCAGSAPPSPDPRATDASDTGRAVPRGHPGSRPSRTRRDRR